MRRFIIAILHHVAIFTLVSKFTVINYNILHVAHSSRYGCKIVEVALSNNQSI